MTTHFSDMPPSSIAMGTAGVSMAIASSAAPLRHCRKSAMLRMLTSTRNVPQALAVVMTAVRTSCPFSGSARLSACCPSPAPSEARDANMK